MARIGVGYLGNCESYLRGDSQTYSQFVFAYCQKKTPSPSDQPFSSYRDETGIFCIFSTLRYTNLLKILLNFYNALKRTPFSENPKSLRWIVAEI